MGTWAASLPSSEKQGCRCGSVPPSRTLGHVLSMMHRAWDTCINLGIIIIIFPFREKVPSLHRLSSEMWACRLSLGQTGLWTLLGWMGPGCHQSNVQTVGCDGAGHSHACLNRYWWKDCKIANSESEGKLDLKSSR